jgi:signal transduction histidine kinase
MFGGADSDLQDRLSSALGAVMSIRSQLAADPQLSRRWRAVKQFQADRLRATYPDLLASDRYRAPCEFFLEELYGAHDFDQRDAEAQRVVPKLAKMLPARAVETLLLAVQLDEMSERFDSELARKLNVPVTAATYAAAYPTVGSEAERERQIEFVDEIGRALDKLARIPMLSTMLHMMKGPAEMWGLSHLHHFLQSGFDAFSGMGGAREFLATIRRRESIVNQRLFACDPDPFRPVEQE